MKVNTERLYQKILDLARKVREDFRRKGMVIPVKNNTGTVRVGSYLIERKSTDFYSVVGIDGEVMVENLNLPQTAVIIANHLALKGYLNNSVIELDREYGYACFEHQLYQHAKSRENADPEYINLRANKYEFSGEQAELHKQLILEQYNKLRKIA